MRNQKVFVAMSGGVDSSVTAALLKKRDFDVRGVHIKMWGDPEIPCTTKEDRYDAMRVAAKLDIPFETWDFTEEYKKTVVDYMVREYGSGRTPNPDVMCNSRIKFGIFLKRALKAGAGYIATGHYARLTRKFENPGLGNCKLKIAKDTNKDQSYFLWRLTQDQLKHCLFPIGEFTKPEVRKMAQKFGLPTASKPDSQGICFIGEIEMKEFLQKYIPQERGAVLTTSGKKIGEHDGLSFYTIGQRQGLGIGGGIPFYVADKDFKTNTLVVGEGPYDENLFSEDLSVADINWISGRASKLPFKCEARIRYRQPLQKCAIKSQISNSKFRVVFSESQRAVTPGQSIVFYKHNELVGGGIIV